VPGGRIAGGPEKNPSILRCQIRQRRFEFFALVEAGGVEPPSPTPHVTAFKKRNYLSEPSCDQR